MVITVLSLTVISASAQSKSTITIKSMTIQNGDTIVKERTYHNDGNAMIYDSLFDDNSRFLYFNNDYHLDTNFNERFSEAFGHEMEDFIKKFNYPSGNLFDKEFDFFDHSLSYNIDSLFSIDSMFTDSFNNNFTDDNNKNESPFAEQWFPYNINCENLISTLKPSIDNFSTEPDQSKGLLKVSFNLDPQKQTVICFNDSDNRTIYKEKLPKSKGLYTRLFDLSVYQPGIYFITVSQGKKQSKSILKFSKNN